MRAAVLRGGDVREEARSIPVLAEADVVVAGGGECGYAAAIGSARAGAKTILVERYGFLGGGLTASMARSGGWEHDEQGRQIIGGVWQETKERLVALGGCAGTMKYDGPIYGPNLPVPPMATDTPFDSEVFKYVAAELVLEAGVELLLHALIVGVVVEDGRVRGVIIEGKSGPAAVLGKVVVDATGDLDVCAAAGVPCQKGRESDGKFMGVTLHMDALGVQQGPLWDYVQANPDDVPRWARLVPVGGGPLPPNVMVFPFCCLGFQSSMQAAKDRGELYFTKGELAIQPRIGPGHVRLNVTRVVVDPTEISGLTYAQVEMRKQAVSIMEFLRRRIPGFQAAYISHTAPEIFVRESRRIIGDYVMTVDELMSPTEYPDWVVLGNQPVEVQNPDTGQREWQLPEHLYQVPYRIFHPTGVENLIVGSARALSVTHEVCAAFRKCPFTILIGQTAGIAAALSAQQGITPRELDTQAIRDTLTGQGAMPS